MAYSNKEAARIAVRDFVGVRRHTDLTSAIESCVAALAYAEQRGDPLPHYVLAALHFLKEASR